MIFRAKHYLAALLMFFSLGAGAGANTLLFSQNYIATFSAKVSPFSYVMLDSDGNWVEYFNPVERFGHDVVFPGSPFEVGAEYELSLNLYLDALTGEHILQCSMGSINMWWFCPATVQEPQWSGHVPLAFRSSDAALGFDIQDVRLYGDFSRQVSVSPTGGTMKTRIVRFHVSGSHDGYTWYLDLDHDMHLDLSPMPAPVPIPAPLVLLFTSLLALRFLKGRRPYEVRAAA